MDKEIGIYCPEILRSQISTSEVLIIANLFGRQEKPLISLKDKYAVMVSLRGFAKSINSSGIDSLINEYTKNGSNLDWKGFFIEPFSERGLNKIIPREGIWMGTMDLLLGLNNNKGRLFGWQ